MGRKLMKKSRLGGTKKMHSKRRRGEMEIVKSRPGSMKIKVRLAKGKHGAKPRTDYGLWEVQPSNHVMFSGEHVAKLVSFRLGDRLRFLVRWTGRASIRSRGEIWKDSWEDAEAVWRANPAAVNR